MASLDELLATSAREGPGPYSPPTTQPGGAGGGGRPGPQLSYRPLERRTLENLLVALQGGLDPGIGMSMLQDTQQSALDRLLMQREKQAQAQALRQEVLPGAIESAVGYAGAGLPSSLTEAAYSGYGPGIQGQIGGALEDLYPGGATTSPYAQEEPAAGGAIDAESLANIDADLQAAIQQGRDLHTTRMAIMTRLRMLGVDDATQQQVFDYIGQQWATLGGAPQGGAEAEAGDGGGSTGRTVRGIAGGILGGAIGAPLGPWGIAGGATLGTALTGGQGTMEGLGQRLGEDTALRRRLDSLLGP